MPRKPPKMVMVVNGRRVSPSNQRIKMLREEEADNYSDINFGTRMSGECSWDIKRLGSQELCGGFERTGNNR